MTHLIDCPECEGEGTIIVLDRSRITPVTISPPEKEIACPLCGGSGRRDEESESDGPSEV
jgi:DnaJ-class molecular chaperone